MSLYKDEFLAQHFERRARKCQRLWDAHGEYLPPITEQNLRDEAEVQSSRKAWLWTNNGETHVGDIMIIAQLAPALRVLNIKLVCITNSSFAPLIASCSDVLEAISNDLPEEVIAARLDHPTHSINWHRLRHYITELNPDLPIRPANYIDVDHNLQNSLRDSYAESGKPIIGLCWRTSLIGREGNRDSALEVWHPLLESKNYKFVSLQYGSPALIQEELYRARIERNWDIHHDYGIDAIADLPSFAAQVKACDAIVTVDCSTVFLAGGLDVPTYTLVSTEPHFKWGDRLAPACPFFGGKNIIIRQDEEGDWGSQIARVVTLLQHRFPPAALPISDLRQLHLPTAIQPTATTLIPPV